MSATPLFRINYIEKVYVYQLSTLETAVFDRLLPTFANLEAEAEAVEQSIWQGRTCMPTGESQNPYGLAEAAHDAGVAHYEAGTTTRQILVNSMTITLHHLFEQQVISFCRYELLNPKKDDADKTFDWEKAIERIKKSVHIDCRDFSSYAKVEELRHVANAVKHADGPSANQIRARRPEMFLHPALRNDEQIISPTHLPIYMPLAGQDLFVTDTDLKEYFDATKAFWKEMMKPLFDEFSEYVRRA